eukprot:TRINITY_DN3022_c0_g1_i3.p1 TRINITY_DN3022_c0_g1~~TRINITY_DN3022_c0_g1_i3.p1  ORF type:complete len:556 (-),score=43.74 TRINITY_DN3022_c0_g1_i3:112-1716(-)
MFYTIVSCILHFAVAARVTDEKGPFSGELAEPDPSLSPLIMFPGFVGSALEYQVTNRQKFFARAPLSCKTMNHPKENETRHIWINVRMATRIRCFKYILTLLKKGKTSSSGERCMSDAPGISIQVPGFGTMSRDVNFLRGAPIPPMPTGGHLFAQAVSDLRTLGYDTGAESQSLAFAVYDFRRVGDPCWEEEYYPKLLQLVERMTAVAGRPATLLCLSQGCNVMQTFLAGHAEQSWKTRHIEQVFASGPAWGGAVEMVKNILEGPKAGLKQFSLNIESVLGWNKNDRSFGSVWESLRVMRPMLNSWPGVHALLPNAGLGGFKDSDVFVETRDKTYTYESLRNGTFLKDVGSTLSEFTTDYLARVDKSLKVHPGVPVNCMYVTDRNTAQRFKYDLYTLQGKDAGLLEGFSVELNPVPGDGFIAAKTMNHACSSWKEQESYFPHGRGRVRNLPLELGGPSHADVFSPGERRMSGIMAILMGKTLADLDGHTTRARGVKKRKELADSIVRALDVKQVWKTADNVELSQLLERSFFQQ